MAQLESGSARSSRQGGLLDIGVSVLPKLPRDTGDRNRTSPFAFTGNKFEFRAVSSSQNIAFPATCLNLAVADSLDYMCGELEASLQKGDSLEDAVGALLRKLAKQHKRIVFNGNGYSMEWQREAGKRGLLNLRNTVDALPELVKPGAVKAFEKFKVLNERELHARYEVFMETYVKTINVEAQLMVLMANRYILPAALEYQKRLGESVAAAKIAGVTSKESKNLLDRFVKLIDQFRVKTEALCDALDRAQNGTEKQAKYMRDAIVPGMTALRELGDQIELLVPHELWPLPTYREMLFIK
jgi:glutamine synthetase